MESKDINIIRNFPKNNFERLHGKLCEENSDSFDNLSKKYSDLKTIGKMNKSVTGSIETVIVKRIDNFNLRLLEKITYLTDEGEIYVDTSTYTVMI